MHFLMHFVIAIHVVNKKNTNITTNHCTRPTRKACRARAYRPLENSTAKTGLVHQQSVPVWPSTGPKPRARKSLTQTIWVYCRVSRPRNLRHRAWLFGLGGRLRMMALVDLSPILSFNSPAAPVDHPSHCSQEGGHWSTWNVLNEWVVDLLGK